jgi:hypothetical protein
MSGVGVAVGFHVGVTPDLSRTFPLVNGCFGRLTTGTLFTPPGVSL